METKESFETLVLRKLDGIIDLLKAKSKKDAELLEKLTDLIDDIKSDTSNIPDKN